MSRILAIGDIHGCSRAFDMLLAAVKPNGGDILVTLGDYIDRGPDSRGVLDLLIDLQEVVQLVSLLGNHEVMALNARSSVLSEVEWRRCGGNATLKSYGSNDLSDIPERHWLFIESSCVGWYECQTHFFVHASAYPDCPLEDQPDYMLYWEPFGHPTPHVSGKVMVCGHTSQRSGQPLNIGHAVCLDTWAYGGGWLTCLDVTTGRVWQANQQGQARTAYIDDFLTEGPDHDGP